MGLKKLIYASLLFIFGLSAHAQIKLIQLQPCIKNGQRQDSCFVMTGSDGLLKFISLQELISISGGGTLVANNDGSYTYTNGSNSTTLKYTCNVIQDSVIRIYNYQGKLASTCTITGMGKAFKKVDITSDSTIRFTNISGQTYSINLCPFVRHCETHDTLTYNTNTNNLSFKNESGNTVVIDLNEVEVTNNSGVYTVTNEVNTSYDIGYHLNCVNDSTIQLVDEQGHTVSTCQLTGGAGGAETITHIINNTNGSYTYINEAGVDTTFGYKFDVSNLNINGYLYLTDQDGTHVDSVNLCNPDCPIISGIVHDDTFTVPSCSVYEGNVTANDTACMVGIGVYSYMEGSAHGGYVSMDANGTFVFTFDDCDPLSIHDFDYEMRCKDGTTYTANVTLNLPACGGATANLDMYSGMKNSTIVFNVKPNDVACASPKLTSYGVVQQPQQGTLVLNSNGSGSFVGLPSFVGNDSAIVGIYCDGVLCDTSWLKFTIKAGNQLKDDYYTIVQGDTLTGLNVGLNDDTCSVGPTTYQWNGALFPSSAGTISGDPDNFSFIAAPFFCGVGHRDYDQYCNGVYNYTATAYFYVSCGNAIDDDWTVLDTLVKKNVGTNDAPCSNGGVTTWHLLGNLTTSGTGLNIPVYNCLGGGGCPGVTADSFAKITAWDTLTGAFTLYLPYDFSGAVCYKYVLKCKAGGKTYLDTACVKVTRIIQAQIAQSVVMKDSITPEFKLTWGAWCLDGNNKKQALLPGDIINFRMNTLNGNINVDLIIGQNILTGAGYTNDVGNRWQNWMIPSINTNSGTMSATALLNSTFFITFRKDTFARKSGNWGDDSNISGTRLGQQLLPSVGVCCTSCNSSLVDVDTIPKLWSSLDLSQWSEKGSFGNTCDIAFNIGHLLGVNSFYTQPFTGEAAKFYTYTQSRNDTTGTWTTMPKSGDYNGGWYQYAAYCHKPAVNTNPNGFNEWRADYDTSATYLYLKPQELQYGTKTDIHRYKSGGVGESLRLFENMNKQSYRTGKILSILEPHVYVSGTYNNDFNAKPAGRTITRITMYVAQNPGDYANVPATRYTVYDITSGIKQDTYVSEPMPEIKWNMPYQEGAYHHWGYMLSDDGKYYSIHNGQTIIFSY